LTIAEQYLKAAGQVGNEVGEDGVFPPPKANQAPASSLLPGEELPRLQSKKRVGFQVGKYFETRFLG